MEVRRACRSEAESLDRCATLGQPHGGSVEKGSYRRDLAKDGGSPGILMRNECMELAAREEERIH